MMKSHRVVAAVLFTALVAVAIAASPAGARETGRTLGGHTFLSSSAVPDPFVATHVGATTGFGLASGVRTTVVGLSGNDVVLEGDLAYLMLNFEYQHAFTEWLAVRGSAAGIGRTGIDEQSAVSPSLSGGFATGVGATVRVWGSDDVQVSVTFDSALSTMTALTPLKFLNEVIEDGFDGDNSFVSTYEVRNTRGGLCGAWAPVEWAGFTVFYEQGVGNAPNVDAELEFALGGLASLDFNKLVGVPVGLLLSGVLDSFAFHDADLAEEIQGYRFGVFYTGRPEFQVGFEGSLNRLPQRGEDTNIDAFTGSLVMQYTF